MSVFRVEKNTNYTVMSNYHLRDKSLSLKAKGLLSLMLSLPDDWDYTLRGLATLSSDGIDSVRTSIVALEKARYISRRQTFDARGRFSGNEYHVFEYPQSEKPSSETPLSENPITENPLPENPTQLNKDRTNKEQPSTYLPITESYPSCQVPRTSRRERMGNDMAAYRELIQENICYDLLLQEYPLDRDRLEEILELLTETVCTTRSTVRISGNDFPADVVRSRLLKLEGDHIRYVFACLKENTTRIRNIRQYLLAVLFNAPATTTPLSSIMTCTANRPATDPPKGVPMNRILLHRLLVPP